jgi:Flp pilus assembly pilin Flp
MGGETMFKRLVLEEDGQTLIEYGLLIGLLALVIVGALTLFGRRVSDSLYGTSNNGLPFN